MGKRKRKITSRGASARRLGCRPMFTRLHVALWLGFAAGVSVATLEWHHVFVGPACRGDTQCVADRAHDLSEQAVKRKAWVLNCTAEFLESRIHGHACAAARDVTASLDGID